MPYRTRRRLRRDNQALRYEREGLIADGAHAQQEHEVETSGLRLALRDIEAERDKAVKLAADLREQLATARAEIASAARRVNAMLGGGAGAP